MASCVSAMYAISLMARPVLTNSITVDMVKMHQQLQSLQHYRKAIYIYREKFNYKLKLTDKKLI